MAMDIQTFSVVIGSRKCNAACPYCISKMTTTKKQAKSLLEDKIDWVNFKSSCQLAKDGGATTVLFTGKGEPTLYPNQMSSFLEKIDQYDFPIKELQTNGLVFQDEGFIEAGYLEKWRQLGLNTISLSIVGVDEDKNKSIFTPRKEYPALEKTIDTLHKHGYTVRLAVTMLEGYVDCPKEVEKVVEYAKEHNVAQIKVTPVRTSKNTENQKTYDWTKAHAISDEKCDKIHEYLEENGTRLLTLMHGACVYDLHDQNICLSDCLTIEGKGEEIRTLIFYKNGTLAYDWQHKGAIIFGPGIPRD